MKVTRRKPKARDKADTKSLDGKETRKQPWMTMAVFTFLLVDLYLLATLFLFRTGEFGQVIHFWTLELFGGGIIVLLVFGAYFLTSRIFGYPVPLPLRQTMASLVL